MTVFEELQRRGLLAQLTSETEIRDLINEGKATWMGLKVNGLKLKCN